MFFPTIDASTALAVGAVFGVGGLLYLDQQRQPRHRRRGRPLPAPAQRPDRHHRDLGRDAAEQRRLVRPARGPCLVGGAVRGSTPAGAAATPVDQGIVITDVHYAYDGSDVLHGVNLDVRAGEHLAVVGTSGAGKTTLGRLIAGVDRPRPGRSPSAARTSPTCHPSSCRQHVVLVTQEHHVFADSLRDNLTIAAPRATDDELIEALDDVGADWFDDLPDGLDTDLGTHRLGGAQAQHVALARVLLADPHTARPRRGHRPAGPHDRSPYRARARRHHKGRTIIAVAHRLQTARDADRIAVMADGSITELGHHDDLLATPTSYAALWRAWSAGTTGTGARTMSEAAKPVRDGPCHTAPTDHVVTGGARGIGAATVEHLARAGHDLVVGYRTDRAAATRTVAIGPEPRCAGRRSGWRRDRRGRTSTSLFAAAADLGVVTGLVNNAGVTAHLGDLADTPVPVVRRVVEVNLVGALLCARAAVRVMSTSRGGHGGAIVNVVLGRSHPGFGPRLRPLRRSQGRGRDDDGGPGQGGRRPRDPGQRRGAGNRAHRDPRRRGRSDRADRAAARIPLGRAGEPGEIAPAIGWLLGPESAYVTGASIRVAGGL